MSFPVYDDECQTASEIFKCGLEKENTVTMNVYNANIGNLTQVCIAPVANEVLQSSKGKPRQTASSCGVGVALTLPLEIRQDGRWQPLMEGDAIPIP
jgi:hypothetical protein